jgi:hypothetical protein
MNPRTGVGANLVPVSFFSGLIGDVRIRSAALSARFYNRAITP